MSRIAAIASALTLSSAVSAAPFQFERLIGQGEIMPGTDLPVGYVRGASINSHGEWAVPVAAGDPGNPDTDFFSGVLGNQGYRLALAVDPDGSPSQQRRMYYGASINDSGSLATILDRYSSSGQLLSTTAFVDGQQAAVASPAGSTIEKVRLDAAGRLLSVSKFGPFGYYSASEQGAGGEWQQEVFHGWTVPTPVGTGRPVGLNGWQATLKGDGTRVYSGSFDQEQADGTIVRINGVVVGDQFIAVDGQESSVPGYHYLSPGGGGVAVNLNGDVGFATGIATSDSPNGVGGAIVINGEIRQASSWGAGSSGDLGLLTELFNQWGIGSSEFSFDNDQNLLWQARSFGQVDPDVPLNSSALMYNDRLLVKSGDTLDGHFILGIREFSMSNDGSWAIANLIGADEDLGQFTEVVYRFQIPTPSSACLFILTGSHAARRRR